jgi:hypothetical protein
LPETLAPFRWFKETPTPGVPAVLFRFARTDVLVRAADAPALGLRLERVPALGFADVLVFLETGTFFDGFNLIARPDRGADPLASVLGAAAAERDFVLWFDP